MAQINERTEIRQKIMQALTNSIILAGKIEGKPILSHTIYEENFYSATIAVRRLSLTTDHIPVTIPEKYIRTDANLNGIDNNSFVRIEGQLRSYNYYMKTEELNTDKRSKLIVTAFCRQILPFEGFINNAELDGYICKAPVYRKTPFGKEITDLLVAVNRNYGKSDYIPVIFWGSNARKASALTVGTHINVSGRVQSRVYEKRNEAGIGEERTTYEVSGFKLMLPDREDDM